MNSPRGAPLRRAEVPHAHPTESVERGAPACVDRESDGATTYGAAAAACPYVCERPARVIGDEAAGEPVLLTTERPLFCRVPLGPHSKQPWSRARRYLAPARIAIDYLHIGATTEERPVVVHAHYDVVSAYFTHVTAVAQRRARADDRTRGLAQDLTYEQYLRLGRVGDWFGRHRQYHLALHCLQTRVRMQHQVGQRLLHDFHLARLHNRTHKK